MVTKTVTLYCCDKCHFEGTDRKEVQPVKFKLFDTEVVTELELCAVCGLRFMEKLKGLANEFRRVPADGPVVESTDVVSFYGKFVVAQSKIKRMPGDANLLTPRQVAVASARVALEFFGIDPQDVGWEPPALQPKETEEDPHGDLTSAQRRNRNMMR